MTFIPLLGYYLLRPKAEPSIEERRQSGFAAVYYKVGHFAIAHRWAFLAASFVVLVAGGWFGRQLKTQFFPQDLQYLSYVDVWLPEDAPVGEDFRSWLNLDDTLITLKLTPNRADCLSMQGLAREVGVPELLPDLRRRLHEHFVEVPQELGPGQAAVQAGSERVDLGLRRHGNLPARGKPIRRGAEV